MAGHRTDKCGGRCASDGATRLHSTTLRRSRRTGLALAILALLAAADGARGASYRASLPPREVQRSTDAFRARHISPELAGVIFLFTCLSDVVEARYDRAQGDCSEAILLSPDNPGAYTLRGEASLFQKRYDAALSDFDRAIALDPADAAIYAGRAEAFRLAGRYRQALSDFTSAIALSPGDAHYWNGRCWLRAEANLELNLALSDCNKSHALSPRFAPALDSRGLVRLRLRHYALAIRDYSEAIRLNANYPTAFFGRGLARLHLGRKKEGRLDVLSARKLDPDIDEVFARLGLTGHGLVLPPLERKKGDDRPRKPGPKDKYANR